MPKSLITIATALTILACVGCVTNRSVQTVKPTDYNLTCEQLQEEMVALGVTFGEAEEDSGVTGENVAMAVVFWPGILVNESRAQRNQESIQSRIDHLGSLYGQKCVQKEE